EPARLPAPEMVRVEPALPPTDVSPSRTTGVVQAALVPLPEVAKAPMGPAAGSRVTPLPWRKSVFSLPTVRFPVNSSVAPAAGVEQPRLDEGRAGVGAADVPGPGAQR